MASITAAADLPSKYHVYIGTYTNAKSKGVYRADFDAETGKLGSAELVAELKNPSFLAVHPNNRFLYAVGQEGDKTGGVVAFEIEPKSGALKQIGKQAACGGGPCHLIVDRTGKCVLTASYGAGTVAALPIGQDGGLGDVDCIIQHKGSSVNPERQKEPHAHSINIDANNRIAVAADLGLDKLLVYDLDAANAKLTPHDPPFTSVSPGGGPRHFAFHPNGKLAVCCNEMTSTVVALAYDADKGTLRQLQELFTLPANYKEPGNSTAEILVHPNGKFVYVSNRGHDSIAIFAINLATGELTSLGHESTGGKTPRNFAIDPTGRYLLAENMASDNIVVFQIDPQTGMLKPTGQTIEVGAPVCIKFVPVGGTKSE